MESKEASLVQQALETLRVDADPDVAYYAALPPNSLDDPNGDRIQSGACVMDVTAIDWHRYCGPARRRAAKLAAASVILAQLQSVAWLRCNASQREWQTSRFELWDGFGGLAQVCHSGQLQS